MCVGARGEPRPDDRGRRAVQEIDQNGGLKADHAKSSRGSLRESGELRLREFVARFEEGKVPTHLLLRDILPGSGEIEEGTTSARQATDDIAEALAFPLEGQEGGIRILREGHRLNRHTCVGMHTRT